MPSLSGRTAAVVITALSCLLGLGASALAVNAVSSAAPDDAKAATSGPAAEVAPAEIIGYGG